MLILKTYPPGVAEISCILELHIHIAIANIDAKKANFSTFSVLT